MAKPELPRRLSSDSSFSSSSPPEFAFWMVGSHPEDQPDLLTADELFVDGVVLPLHLLSLPRHDPQPQPQPQPPHQTEADPPPPSAPISSSSAGQPSSGSKRWKDIFKVAGEKKPTDYNKDRRSKGDRKSSAAGNPAAELNINIWPFSRSRSAGNAIANSATTRASAAGTRKSSSAPCSRSNSRGESSKPAAASGISGSRRWAASPGRGGGGVHLGRASPVWQLRRPAKEKAPAVGGGRTGGTVGGARGLSLNVNTCIGYQSQVNCRSDQVAAGAGDRAGGNGSLFKLRTLFSKKVY